jgi:hypothetical protein
MLAHIVELSSVQTLVVETQQDNSLLQRELRAYSNSEDDLCPFGRQ